MSIVLTPDCYSPPSHKGGRDLTIQNFCCFYVKQIGTSLAHLVAIRHSDWKDVQMTLLKTLIHLGTVGLLFTACGRRDGGSKVAEVDYASLKVVKGFTIFDSDSQAKDWYSSYRSVLSLALGGEAGDVIDFADKRYVVLNEMIAKLWPAFQKLYPDEVEGVSAPTVLILQNTTPNAFATYDRNKKIDPNVFFVLSGLIEGDFDNREAVMGVLSHELSHHALHHSVPGVSSKIDKYYVADSREPLGALQKNDVKIKDLVGNWIEAATLIGPFSLPEMRGMPIPSFGYPHLFTLTKSLAAPHADRDACSKMNDAASDAVSIIGKGLNIATQELNISDASELKKLDAIRDHYNKQLADCLHGETKTVLDAMTSLFGITESQAFEGSALTEKERAMMKVSGNTAEALIAFSNRMSDKKTELNRQTDISKVRIYTIEEQADDAAVEILLAIGESSEPLIKFFKSAIPSSQIGSCLSAIDEGKVPGYGVLSDKHHSTCYRIFHAKQIESHLLARKSFKIAD